MEKKKFLLKCDNENCVNYNVALVYEINQNDLEFNKGDFEITFGSCEFCNKKLVRIKSPFIK